MGVLSEKSEKSYKAALLLLSNENYCNSIQCSYFSCLQLAKDKILTVSSNPEIIEKELKDSNISHLEIINRARVHINGTSREKGVMLELMTRMKRWRKNAIYESINFVEKEAFEAITNCESVNRILKKT